MERTFEITEDLLASQGQRFANFVIDYIIRILIGLFIGFLIGAYCVMVDDYEMLNSVENMGRATDIIISLIILVIYYFLTGVLFKRSIAKYITKTIVVFEDGSIPDNTTFLRRALCRLIPFEIFSFLGTPSRGWHDTITDTYVVKKEEFETARDLFYSLDEIGSEIENKDYFSSENK